MFSKFTKSLSLLWANLQVGSPATKEAETDLLFLHPLSSEKCKKLSRLEHLLCLANIRRKRLLLSGTWLDLFLERTNADKIVSLSLGKGSSTHLILETSPQSCCGSVEKVGSPLWTLPALPERCCPLSLSDVSFLESLSAPRHWGDGVMLGWGCSWPLTRHPLRDDQERLPIYIHAGSGMYEALSAVTQQACCPRNSGRGLRLRGSLIQGHRGLITT